MLENRRVATFLEKIVLMRVILFQVGKTRQGAEKWNALYTKHRFNKKQNSSCSGNFRLGEILLIGLIAILMKYDPRNPRRCGCGADLLAVASCSAQLGADSLSVPGGINTLATRLAIITNFRVVRVRTDTYYLSDIIIIQQVHTFLSADGGMGSQ